MLDLTEGDCRDCRHYVTGSENQAPIGSGYNWPEPFEECAREGDWPDDKAGADDWQGTAKNPCPLWEPVGARFCSRHASEYREGGECPHCVREEGERMREAIGAEEIF